MKTTKTKQKREGEVVYKISIPEIKQNIKELTPSEIKESIAKLILRKAKQKENLEQMKGAIVKIDEELELLNQAINLINK